MYAEICISVSATSPKEAAEFFEKGLDKAFGKYNINDAIFVIDEETGIPQVAESEEFDLD